MSRAILSAATRHATAKGPHNGSDGEGEQQPQVEAAAEDTVKVAITNQTGEETAVGEH